MASGAIGERRWFWGGGALHAVNWGEETVAFNEATASTHCFDQDTYRLVEALRQSDRTLTRADLWSNTFSEAASASDLQALDDRLESMLQAGLVTAKST